MNTSTNNTETQDQTIVCNVISQRNRFLSLLTPPSRYTPVSPYPTYTKQQLDMRRKVEILQYKKNSSQTSQPTKTQKWSQIANASTNRITACNKNPYTPSPSSACDVPGPLVYLSYDPTVPLYNYNTRQDPYAMFYTTPPVTWEFILASDISGGYMSPGVEDIMEPQETEEEMEVIENEATHDILIGQLMIQDIKDPITSYKFVIPIGLFVNGNSIGTPTYTLTNLKITKATLNIFFYSDSVAVDPTTPPLMAIPITNSLTNTGIFDLSMSFIPTIENGPFYCNQYIGDIIVPNIKLTTSYGFLYDFRLYFEVMYEPINNPNIGHNDVQFGVYLNMPRYNTDSSGCIVTPQSPSIFSKYLPFYFDQV